MWKLIVVLALSTGAWAQSRRANLADQRMCAVQAQKRFDEYVNSVPPKDRAGSTITVTNHFDPKLRVCYVAIHNYFPDEGGLGEMMDVSDAFENTLVGSFMGTVSSAQKVTVFNCIVADVDCHSAQEFRQAVRQKLGMSL